MNRGGLEGEADHLSQGQFQFFQRPPGYERSQDQLSTLDGDFVEHPPSLDRDDLTRKTVSHAGSDLVPTEDDILRPDGQVPVTLVQAASGLYGEAVDPGPGLPELGPEEISGSPQMSPRTWNGVF